MTNLTWLDFASWLGAALVGLVLMGLVLALAVVAIVAYREKRARRTDFVQRLRDNSDLGPYQHVYPRGRRRIG